MISEPHTDMHADHRRWLADLAMWQDDLNLWVQELSATALDLGQAVGALEDHRKAVGCHGEQLREEQERVANDERAIGRYDHGEPVPGLVQVVEGHAEGEQGHLRLRSAHERLKRYHHMILARASLLLKALAEPM